MLFFFAGTKVAIDFNDNTKNIEDMQIGDYVLSYNLFTHKNYIAKVKRLIIHHNTTDKAILTCENGTILTMREYHPLLTDNGWKSLTGYNKYPVLQIGDNLKTVNGYTKLINVEIQQVKPIDTYTLNVIDLDETFDDDTNDNFYANGICNHNAICAG